LADDPAKEAVPIGSRCNLNAIHYLDLIIVPIRFARFLVRVSKSPLVMDGLVQTVLSGNIFIQTQCFQKVVKLCFGVRFEPGLRCLLSSKKFHESVWKATAPEPVCGQRQCLIGRIVGNQRSDTPDQSAARSTTLGHFLQRSNEREGEQKENSAANKKGGS